MVAGFNARKLISDQRAAMAMMKAVTLDSFEAMLKPVGELDKAIQVFIESVKEVSQEMGKAQVEFEKFYSGDDLSGITVELKEIGLEFGKVGIQALNAGSRASQVGQIIGNENIPLLVRQAEILSNISDMTSEEAMKGIIQLQQQTGVLYGSLTAAEYKRLTVQEQGILLTQRSAYALDALNTIANRSVALEGDLVNTMTNFAAQGQLVGESFHDMAAMSAVLLEAGEEQGAAGRSLRMMYARLGGNIGNARDKMEEMGLTVTDQNGNLKTMREIMKQLTDKGWAEMSSAQKQNIAQTVAGNRHYVRFIKLMENNDRFLQLAADGMEGYDSATEQAENAMKNFAYQLEIAEARGENLKAELGETFNPFMVGQQEAQNQILEVQEDLANMFGPTVMKHLGRFSAYMKYAGGFVKFGLGVQGMALGMSMFEAVQGDLHGLMVANENLHSKQATWMDYNIRATKEEVEIISKIRFAHQQINATLETRNQLKNNLKTIDLERVPQLEREGRLQEYINQKNLSIYHINKQGVQVRNMKKALSMNELDTASRYSAIIKADLANQYSEVNLLSEFNRIKNTAMTSEMSFRQQMIIDHETMNLLGTDELKMMHARKGLLEQEMGMFQRIVADNERLRGLRTDEKGGGGTSTEGIVNSALFRESADAVYLVKEQLKQLRIEQKNVREGDEEGAQAVDDAISGYRALEEQLEDIILVRRESADVQREFAKGFKWERNAAWAAVQMSKKRTGSIIQIDNNLSKMQVSMLELAKVEEDLNILDRARVHNYSDLKNATLEMDKVQRILGESGEEYADILREIESEQRKGNDTMKQQKRLQEILKQGYDETNAFHKEMGKITDKERTKAIGKATDATRKFAFAASAVASVGLPMVFNDTNSAMASTIMMTSTLTPALMQLGKATMGMVKAQALLVADLGGLAKGWKTLVAAMAPALIAITAITAALWVMSASAKGYERADAALAKTLAKQNESIVALKTQTHLFTEEQTYLAEKLGLTNVTISDLVTDESLLRETTNKLSESYEWMDKTQIDATDSAKELVKTIKALNDEMAFADTAAMKRAFRKEKENYEGVSSGWGFFGWVEEIADSASMISADLLTRIPVIGRDEEHYMQKDLATLDNADLFSDDAISRYGYDEEVMLDELEKILLDEQIKLDDDILGALQSFLEPEAFAFIESINENMLTSGTLDSIMSKQGSDLATDNLEGLADSLKNLTEDVYDFGNAKEELFFGGKYGNVTGSLYKQVVKQGVGVLYNKMDIVMANNFHGFFNEQEAADRIIAVLNSRTAELSGV